MRLLPAITLLACSVFTAASAAAVLQTNTVLLRKGPAVIPSSWKQLEAAVVDQNAPYTFTLILKSRDMPGLTTRMEQISLENQGKWLSDDELGNYASPTEHATASVMKYLASNGISRDHIKVSKYGDQITVTTTVGKTAKMFKAKLRKYRVESEGAELIRSREFSIPADISDHVHDVSPLAHFNVARQVGTPPMSSSTDDQKIAVGPSQPIHHRRAVDAAAVDVGDVCNIHDVTPACLKKYYGSDTYQPSSKKSGGDLQPDVAVMAYQGQSFDQAELASYLKQYAPETADYKVPITYMTESSTTHKPGEVEVQMAIALETIIPQIYPLTTSYNVYDNYTSYDDMFFGTFTDLINNFNGQNRPKIVVATWFGDETYNTLAQAQSMCDAAQKLSALGVTIVVPGGNGGVDAQGGECPTFRPAIPQVCPYVLVVGATQGFNSDEIVAYKLGEPNAHGNFSGAGVSDYFPLPSYQSAQVAAYEKMVMTPVLQKNYNKHGRHYPDMTAYGSYEMRYLFQGKPFVFGGTTASSSLAASLLAKVNSKRFEAGKGQVGWAQPALYQTMLKDITQGGSGNCGKTQLGFPASIGWDTASGLGAAHFDVLSRALGV